MDAKLAERIVLTGMNCGFDVEIYEGYSGRGMYGEQTTGVQADDYVTIMRIMLQIGAELGYESDHEQMDQFDDLLQDLRSDNLGFRKIFY